MHFDVVHLWQVTPDLNEDELNYYLIYNLQAVGVL